LIFIYYLLFFIFFLILIKKKKEFIYYLPIFFIITESSFTYFSSLSFATFYRVIMILLFFYYIKDKIKFDPLSKVIIIFLIFILFETIISSEFLFSFKNTLKVILSMMMFTVGYHLINDINQYNKLIKSIHSIIILSLIFVVFGYVFKIGRPLEYTFTEGEEDIIGLLGSGGLYPGAVALSILPISINLIKKRSQRVIFVFLSIIFYIFILLNVRRTAIILPLIGFFVIIIFNEIKFKFLINIILIFLILLIMSPFYKETLIQRIEIRNKQRENELTSAKFYEKEQRYLENIILIQEIFSSSDPINALFGINNNIFANNVKNNKIIGRLYHSDTAVLLYGGGIIGFFLYFFVIYKLFIWIFKFKTHNSLGKEYFIISLILLLQTVFIIFNGSLTLFAYKSVTYLLLGATLHMQKNIYYLEKVKK